MSTQQQIPQQQVQVVQQRYNIQNYKLMKQIPISVKESWGFQDGINAGYPRLDKITTGESNDYRYSFDTAAMYGSFWNNTNSVGIL